MKKRFVGNCVVHFGHPENEARTKDRTLLDQYFSETEQQIIFSSADFLENVWILWSCKTTAHSIAKKMFDDPPKFNPRKMQVIPFGGEYATSHHTIYARVTTEFGPIFTETMIEGQQLSTIGATDLNAMKEVKHQHFMLPDSDDEQKDLETFFLDHITTELNEDGQFYTLEQDDRGNHNLMLNGENSGIDLAFSNDHGLAGFAYLLAE